jgi:hypothetical protein
MLVHRQRASETALHAIESADKILTTNKNPLAGGKRADVDSAHLGIWGDYNIGLYETRETENLYENGGEQWFDLARPGLEEISNIGRHLNPEMYGMLGRMDLTQNIQRTHGKNKEKNLQPIAGMFFAVALNRQQTDNGIIHQDWADSNKIFNAAIAYGEEYETAWLIIWQLEVIIEMKRGDIVFFYGSFLAHNVIEISGERNSLDLFTHKSVLDWWKRIKYSKTDKNRKRKLSDDDCSDSEVKQYFFRTPAELKISDISKLKQKDLKQKGLMVSLSLKIIFKIKY